MNVFLYISAVCAIGFAVALTVAGDLILWLTGHATISAWLRQNPECFWVPAAVMLTFIVALAVHLFVLPLLIEGY